MNDETPVGLFGLSRLTQLPVDWLDAAERSGRIPSLRVGRRRLFDVAAVRAALAQQAAGVRSEGPQAAASTLTRHFLPGGGA